MNIRTGRTDAHESASGWRWELELKRQMLSVGRDTQRLDEQMQAMSGVRLWPSVLGSNQCIPLALPAPLQPEVSDQQIERIAQKAVKRYSTETEWDEWQAMVRTKLPRYAAEEVIHRADEIRGLVDDDGFDGAFDASAWEDDDL